VRDQKLIDRWLDQVAQGGLYAYRQKQLLIAELDVWGLLIMFLLLIIFLQLFFQVAHAIAFGFGVVAVFAKKAGNVGLVNLEVDQDKKPARPLHHKGKYYDGRNKLSEQSGIFLQK
jgi:hypothetical protein